MKRLLITLIPWMVVASSASAIQSRSAEVVFTYLGAMPERGIRVADECFVPLSFLEKVGWRYTVRNTSVVIESDQKGARVPLREFDLGQMIPLRAALDQMGAETLWEPDNDRLLVCSPVTKVTIKGNVVEAETLLPIRPRVYRLTNPHRLIVDLPGTRLGRETVQKVENRGVEVTQVEMNTVRIAGSIAEVDAAQIAILRQMAPAMRFQLGCSNSDTARTVTAHRLRRKDRSRKQEHNPSLRLEEEST